MSRGAPNPWRFCGYEREKGDVFFCEMPGRMVNVETGEWHMSKCGSSRKSVCEPCAEVHRKDVASISRSGWTDKPTERGYLTTLSAPGKEELPWDPDRCNHSEGIRCSGKIGCKVQTGPMAIWNSAMGARWTHFMTELRRQLAPGEAGPVSEMSTTVEFVKTYEPQLRDALHVHSMIRIAGIASDARIQAAIRKAAELNGFGEQVDIQVMDLADARTVARVAGYVAKYITKSADAVHEIATVDRRTGEIKPGGCRLRSWSASMNWGDKMWETKQRRIRFASNRTGNRDSPPGEPGSGGAALDPYQDRYALDLPEACPLPCAGVLQPV